MKNDTFAGFSISGRSVTVRAYDTLAQPLLEYISRLNLPWKKDEKLKVAIASLRADLAGLTAFVDLIVSIPPPKQKAPMDGISLDYRIHGEEFCNWFINLHHVEVREVVEGTVAYRFTKVMPFCRVEKVTFYTRSGWLSQKQQQDLKENGYLKD